MTMSLIRSFAGGEITPELFGRLDLVKYQTGLARASNCIVLPHGPVQNRPGFSYVLEAKDSTKRVRIIPFAYSTEQTFVIEFGDQYVRWHTQGATLLETGKTITGITQASPGVVTSAAHGFSNGDWVYLSGIGGMTGLNGRYVKVAGVAANTFQITNIHGGGNIDTTALTAYTSGGTAARVYTLSTPYLEADLFGLHFVQSADVLTIVHPSYAPRELRRLSATSWQLTSISFTPSIAAPALPTVVAGGPGGGSPTGHYYVTTAVASDTLEESLASPNNFDSSDLTVTGNYIDITPAVVAGAVRYNVYKLSNGLYGYIGQTTAAGLRDTNLTPDISQTPPELANPFSGANEYPGAVGYHDQRRCFGGSNNKPQNFWATRSATESNLAYSIPTRDDDSIFVRIAAREVNRIRHIVSLDQLILLTSGGPWRLAPQNSDILTPDSAAPKQLSTDGASNVQPVITGSSILYAQAAGGHLQEMRYQWEANGYQVGDISILAPHLFDTYTLVDLAYSRAPSKLVWAVRSDGVLLGLTYLPEQEVTAWHQHSTDGTFESVAAIQEGTEYPLYAVVKRRINGRDVRYIERLHTRVFTAQEDAFFVDSGLTYDGSPTSTITGLWHLEGAEVAVLADGAELTGLTVTNGRLTLEQAASVVHAGLPITSEIQTLPLVIEAKTLPTGGQGITKNINSVALRLKDSSGFSVGPDFDSLVEWTQRRGEDYGTPPSLFTGVEEITVSPEWGQDAHLCIRQTAPLPFTVLAMALDVATGG